MESEWCEVTLGDALTLQRGFDLAKDKRADGEIPIIASNGITGWHNEFKVEAPGVVIGRSGSIGGGQYIEEDFWPLNTTLWVKDFKGNNERFCYYLLLNIDFQTFNVGSGVPTLNRNHIHPLPISLPSQTEQKAIAHILGSLDDKIELNRQMNETLEAMAQALFKSWFVDFDPVIDNALVAGNVIPDVLKKRAAERAVHPSTGLRAIGVKDSELRTRKQAKSGGVSFNTHPSTGSGRTSVCADALFVRPESRACRGIEGFPDAFEYTEEMGWIPEGWESEKLSELLEVKYGKDHKKLEEGNIPVYGSGGLMRLVNQSLFIGESILIPRKGTLSNLMFVDEEFWTVDTMFFSIPKLKHVAKYLFHQLKLLDLSSMNVGSAVPSMTTKVLNDLNILKPQSNVLEEFDRLVTDFFNKEKSLREENNSLSKLRDTLLPKLLSGELRIPDAEKLIEEAI